MKRIKLILEYDGTAYAGWQRQVNAIAVQQRVEEAIASLTGTPHSVTGASRTDAGVHARGQTVHFDTQSPIPPERWLLAMNTRLPSDIRVVHSEQADSTFHARFHAERKCYTYSIVNAAHAPAIGRQYAWHFVPPLDVGRMQEAARTIEGTHDFACCMASGGESKTTVRTVFSAIVEQKEETIRFAIEGDGFLYNMVRILAGTLCYVGQGKLPTDSIARALQTGDRLLLGPTAPPQGLCLEWIQYSPTAK